MITPDPHSLDRRLVKRAFESAVPTYDAAAGLQREVCARLLERLDYVKLSPSRILDLGCGTGQAVPVLRRRYRGAEIVAVDLAEGMLRATGRRAGWLRRPRLLCADAQQLPLRADSVDLVFSSMAFQWCQDLERLFADLRRVLRPGGLLTFTTCGPDTLKELRAAWSVADGYTHTNHFADMHDVGDALVRAGFLDPVLDVDLMRLHYRRVAELMRDLKAIGAHNVTAGRRHGLTGKQRLSRMQSAYVEEEGDAPYPSSWEIVYGLAWGPDSPGSRRVALTPGR